MKWWCALLLFMGGVAGAEVLTSPAMIELPAGENYSCRILRHRAHERVKGQAGLQSLLRSMEDPSEWRPGRTKRLAAQLGRSGYFPKFIFAESIKVSVRWTLPLEWAAVMNSADSVSVNWSFKDEEWSEERGIMPSQVQSEWLAETSEIQVTTMITPLDLCFSPGDLRLALGHGQEVLELQSLAEWL